MATTAKQNLINALLATGAFGSNQAVVASIVETFQNFVDARIRAVAITTVVAGDQVREDQR